MFYGESEDITDVINRIVDERVNEKIQEKENEKGKCLAWASIVRNSDNSWTIQAEYNIKSITKTTDATSTLYMYKIEFENALNNRNYAPFVSGDIDGVSKEIIGVHSKMEDYFCFDFSNLEGKTNIPDYINIFVWGNQ